MLASFIADVLNQLSIGRFVIAIGLLALGLVVALAANTPKVRPAAAAAVPQIGSGNANQGHTVINNCNNCNNCTIVTPNKPSEASNKE